MIGLASLIVSLLNGSFRAPFLEPADSYIFIASRVIQAQPKIGVLRATRL